MLRGRGSRGLPSWTPRDASVPPRAARPGMPLPPQGPRTPGRLCPPRSRAPRDASGYLQLPGHGHHLVVRRVVLVTVGEHQPDVGREALGVWVLAAVHLLLQHRATGHEGRRPAPRAQPDRLGRPRGPPHPRRQPGALHGGPEREEGDSGAGRGWTGSPAPTGAPLRTSTALASPRQQEPRGLPGSGGRTLSLLSMTSEWRQQRPHGGTSLSRPPQQETRRERDKGPLRVENRSVPSEGHCEGAAEDDLGLRTRGASPL